jgi:hypothetical protein
MLRLARCWLRFLQEQDRLPIVSTLGILGQSDAENVED